MPWSRSTFSPGAVAGVAMVVASTCAAPVAIRVLMSSLVPTAETWAVATSTAVLTMLFAHFVTHARGGARVATWCFLGAPAFGAFNAGLTLAILLLTQLGVGPGLFALVLGTLFGGVVGAPLGLLFGCALYVPAEVRRRADEGGSLAATDHTAVASGLWLLGVGAILVAMDHANGWALPPLGLGTLLALGGGAQLLRRWRGIARLRAGDVPGFRVVRRRPEDEAVPMLRLDASRCAHTVVRVQDASPYRDDRPPAVALL